MKTGVARISDILTRYFRGALECAQFCPETDRDFHNQAIDKERLVLIYPTGSHPA
jgi:hypothetical protein